MIAEEAGVSYSWISKFVRREINNPRYQTLVRLSAYLQPKRKVKA